MEEVIPAEQLTLKRCLGRGGFAIVYAGFYNVDGRKEPVAIKVLCPAEENQNGEDPTSMFLREARQTKKQEHEHIIRCYGLARIPPNHPGVSGLITKTAWAMVLELAEPYTTKTLITQGMTENRRTYTNLQAYTWLAQLASALAHLHSNKPPIIHRDIKQENLLLKKVTRPPPAADSGVPVGAQRLPGGGGGTHLEAKLADLGLHVVVEQDRSVMLRRKSRYGSQHNGSNRSVHNRSVHGANRSAHGGSMPGGTDSPFLAVSTAPSAAPSAMHSRAPSEYGLELSGAFAGVPARSVGDGDEDEDSAAGGGSSIELGASYVSTAGGRISGSGRLSGAAGVTAGEDTAAAGGRRRRRRRISFDRDVRGGAGSGDEGDRVVSEPDSDGSDDSGKSDEVHIVDIHGALGADSAPPSRPGTANLTAAATAAAAAAESATEAAGGSPRRRLPTSRLSRTSLLPAAGAAQPSRQEQGQGGQQGQQQELPGAQQQPTSSAASATASNAAAPLGRGQLPSPTVPPGAVQALRDSGNGATPMLGSPSGRRDVLPPLHWNDALFRAASHKHPEGSAAAAIHTLAVGGADSGADSGFDDSPRPTADGDGAGAGDVEGIRTSPAEQGARSAGAQHESSGSSRQLPQPVTKRPGYMGASGGEPGSVAVVSAGQNGSLAARPISASSQQHATPSKSSSGGGAGSAAGTGVATPAHAAASPHDPANAAGGNGHPRMELTVAVAEAAAGHYSTTPLEPVETQMSPVPGRVAAAAAGAPVSAAAAAMAGGGAGAKGGRIDSPGAAWNVGGGPEIGSAHSAVSAGRAGSGVSNLVGVGGGAGGSSYTGTSTGPGGLPPIILEDYSFIGGLTDAHGELPDNRPGVDFRYGGQQQPGAAAGGGASPVLASGAAAVRQSSGSISHIVLLPRDGSAQPRPASKSRLGLHAVVNPLASMAVTGGGGLGGGTASSQSTSRHRLALSAPVSKLELTPRQNQQHQQAAGAGAPPPLEHKDSLGAILNRNPDLLVAQTGSFTSGLRRVHSVLSQFRQSELKQLRQSSFEWVFGLTGKAGSCMYMAPEVFRKLPYNEKADVFSFGVVMYELLSRELLVISYFNTSRGAKLGMHQPEDYAEMVCDGFRPARPTALANDAVWSLIEACWHDDPVQRPDMDTVLVRLQELRREEELHPTDPGGLMGCSCVIC